MESVQTLLPTPVEQEKSRSVRCKKEYPSNRHYFSQLCVRFSYFYLCLHARRFLLLSPSCRALPSSSLAAFVSRFLLVSSYFSSGTFSVSSFLTRGDLDNSGSSSSFIELVMAGVSVTGGEVSVDSDFVSVPCESVSWERSSILGLALLPSRSESLEGDNAAAGVCPDDSTGGIPLIECCPSSDGGGACCDDGT